MSISGSAKISGSGNLQFYIMPSAPTNLIASSITSTTAVIGFTAPPSAANISSYNVYNTGVFLGSYTGTNMITLSGLTASTNYVITLAAVSSKGVSQVSTSVSFNTVSSSKFICYYKGDYLNGTSMGDYNGISVIYDGLAYGSTPFISSTIKYGSNSFNCAGTAIASANAGTNYFIAQPTSLSTVSNNGFSFSMWVYPINVRIYAGYTGLFTIDNLLTTSVTAGGGVVPMTIRATMTLYQTNPTLLLLIMPTNGTSDVSTKWYLSSLGSNQVPLNTWFHFVFTISTSGNWSVYINNSNTANGTGSPIVTGFGNNGTNNYSGSTSPTYSYTSRIALGKDTTNFASNFNGYIDQFSMYNKTLTTADITNLYNGNILY